MRCPALDRLFCAWCLISSAAMAEDRVTFSMEPGGAPVILIGTIRDYTGKFITVQPEGKTPQAIPVEQIVSVETYYSDLYREAIGLFEAGDTVAALPVFEQALKEEHRRWVQREQYAWIMRCRHRQGDLLGVAAAFLDIVNSDPQTQHWRMAPLIWTPTALGTGQLAQAKSWLASGNPTARLIGASWLLTDPTFGTPAQRALDELARDTNGTVAQLARIQLWRLRFGPSLSDLAVSGWEHDLDLIPQHLHAGPRYLIGRGYAQRQEYRHAAAAYLWLPLVHRDHEPLAARACLDAADALRRSGLTQEAENLYREVLVRYAWSPVATEARQALQE